MPREYKTKEGSKKRKPVDQASLKQGVQAVLAGYSLRSAAKTFNVSIMTLRRYVLKQKEQKEEISYVANYKSSQFFTDKEEYELVVYLQKAVQLHGGLSPKRVRQLVYEYACEKSKSFSAKWQLKGEATYDWLHGFMSRHPNLSLRSAEENRPEAGQVTTFDDLPSFLLERLAPEQICNDSAVQVSLDMSQFSAAVEEDERPTSTPTSTSTSIPALPTLTPAPGQRLQTKPPHKCAKQALNRFNNVDGTQKQNSEDDECDLFGKLLAKKLRKIPDHEREMLMFEIDGLVIKWTRGRNKSVRAPSLRGCCSAPATRRIQIQMSNARTRTPRSSTPQTNSVPQEILVKQPHSSDSD